MCDECTYCYRAGWETELRLTPANELICHDCHDDGQDCGGECSWHDLLTPDDLAEMHIAALDDKAHAMAERRAGL